MLNIQALVVFSETLRDAEYCPPAAFQVAKRNDANVIFTCEELSLEVEIKFSAGAMSSMTIMYNGMVMSNDIDIPRWEEFTDSLRL